MAIHDEICVSLPRILSNRTELVDNYISRLTFLWRISKKLLSKVKLQEIENNVEFELNEIF